MNCAQRSATALVERQFVHVSPCLRNIFTFTSAPALQHNRSKTAQLLQSHFTFTELYTILFTYSLSLPVNWAKSESLEASALFTFKLHYSSLPSLYVPLHVLLDSDWHIQQPLGLSTEINQTSLLSLRVDSPAPALYSSLLVS